jgi:hypothetical protein
LVVAIAVEEGEAVPRTGSAGGVEAELVVLGADEVGIEEVVEIASCAGASVGWEHVAVYVAVLDKLRTCSTRRVV